MSSASSGGEYRGWRVVKAGAVIQGLQSALILQALGSYLVVLEAAFGWSKLALSVSYSLNRAESALLGPLQGWLIDRYGPRRIARIGAVVLAAGFVAFSQIQTLWQFFAAFVLVSVGAALCGFLTVTVAIVRWFERRRARALALGGMGFAIGGICVPLVVRCIEWFGWRWTAGVSGVGASVVFWLLAGLLHGEPADYGQTIDGAAGRSVPNTRTPEGLTRVHFTAREAVRTRAFWMISLGHMSALLAVGAVLAHLPLYLTEDGGYTLFQASIAAGALPMVQLGGMGIGVWLGDKVNKRLIATVAMSGHAAGMLVLTLSTHVGAIALFVVLHGLAWGARGPLMQAMRADYFGSTSFGAIMGISSTIVMFGTVIGPLVVGVAADVASYRWGFGLMAALVGLGTTFFVLATPPAQPHRPAPEPDDGPDDGSGGGPADDTGRDAATILTQGLPARAQN